MFSHSFMQNALIVSIFVAVLCPCIGIFLVLRRQSMIGDALSHAALAGVALGLLTGQNPVLGAFVFTSGCGLLIEFLRSYFRKYADLILSVTLSLGIGIAITIISTGRLSASADAFLFGSILTVTTADMLTIAALTAVSAIVVALMYDRLVYIAFDEEAARVAGVRVRLINYVFSVLVAAAISASIRIVGMLVLGTMIALPVAAALQLGRGFKATLLFSVLFGLVDVTLGLVLSYQLGVAPGGFTALVSVAVLLSVIALKGILRLLLRRTAGPYKKGS